MKKIGLIALLALLCGCLSGCSAGTGGIFCGVLIVLALGILIVAFLRAQSLARFRRKRRLNKRQRAWLKAQIALTDLMYVAAVVLLGIGIIVGIASSLLTDVPPDDPTTSVTEEQAPGPTAGPVAGPTETTTERPPETPSVSGGNNGSGEDGPPDLMGIPESLLELMEKNPETTEFVLNYPDRQPMEVDLSDFDLSQGVPLFMQWDMRWGYHTYGSDVMAITGCAPTCLAMVGYYLTGEDRFTPDKLADFALEHDYYVSGNGTKWTFIGEGAEMLGLSSTELPLVEEVIIRNLRAGNPVITVMGPGDFTTSGHYVVIVGYEDGLFKINDPNRRANSERLWSYETLAPQIRNLWAIRLQMS